MAHALHAPLALTEKYLVAVFHGDQVVDLAGSPMKEEGGPIECFDERIALTFAAFALVVTALAPATAASTCSTARGRGAEDRHHLKSSCARGTRCNELLSCMDAFFQVAGTLSTASYNADSVCDIQPGGQAPLLGTIQYTTSLRFK